jgi:leucyl/phenylalanyl-tRNA--protein transferase
MFSELTPDTVLFGYSIGVFPMADSDENNEIGWYAPDERGIIPLDGLKINKSMQQVMRLGKFTLTINTAFEEVMRMCAKRDRTWISEDIIEVYCQLHEMGYAHSFETRNKQGELVGGLYGIALGRAFFGESMFHIERDASKFALIKLVDWLNQHEYVLLDTQYTTPHLESMGAITISKSDYMILLNFAMRPK